MLDRTQPPEFKTDFSYPLINPQVFQSNGNVDIHVVSAGDQNVVKLEVIFNAGKWYESRPGVSQLTASMLNKGTHTRSSIEISSLLDRLGVHFEATAGYDFTTLSLYGLPSNVIQVLPVFSEFVFTPSFPTSELEILRSQLIQSLRINLEKNSYVAGCMSREAIFGALHPYGRNLSISDLEQASVADLVKFHNDRFVLHGIVLSGKVDKSTEDAVLRAFGKFRKDTPPVLPVAAGSTSPNLKIEKVDSVQTSLRIGKKTIDRKHPDYATILLLNHALGGYFGSRLMANIREEKGLTYGIYSSISALKRGSFFSIGTDVRKETMELAITEIKHEIEQLRKNLIPVEEFNTVKNHFVGSLQTELSTPFAHAEKIKTMLLHELPSDFYSELLDKISNLTPDDLQKCAVMHLDPSSMVTVTVG